MAINLTSANTTTQIFANVAGDIWVIAERVFVNVVGDAINGATANGNKTFLIHGHVVADGFASDGIALGSGGSGGDNRVHVYDTGSIAAEDVAVESVGGGLVLVNEGSLSGHAQGIFLNDANNRVVNHGTIVSTGKGFDSNGNGFVLRNYGLIEALSDAVDVTGSGHRIENHGTIATLASSAYGIDLRFAGGDNLVVNTGLITGGAIAIEAGAGIETVRNSGTIDGDVLLGDGADAFDGRGGTVSGSVRGGAGNDSYAVDDPDIRLVEQAGEGTDTVFAATSFRLGPNFENLTLLGAGNDRGIGNGVGNTINGNDADNVLSGLGGNDVIVGREGDDVIRGGSGNDALGGSEGDDILVGEGGADAMNGNDGDDVLRGGDGADNLFGADGEDVLIGRNGADTLTGGADGDTFVFKRKSDSIPGPLNDVITDFQAGIDLIDLTAIDAVSGPGSSGNQAFTFIGAAGFTGAGQVRAFTFAGNTFVDAETTGDGVLDFRIQLTGLVALTAADFAL